MEQKRGKLYFKYGTMGSAKTAMLLTTAYNFEERGMGYVCYKPIVDTREARSVIRSRIGIELACRWIKPETDMYDEISQLMHTHPNPPGWVLIDEAQFMSEAQVDQLARVVDDFGINVLCYVNARIDSHGNIITEGQQVEIGGNERYMAVCRVCWRSKKIAGLKRASLPFDDLPSLE